MSTMLEHRVGLRWNPEATETIGVGRELRYLHSAHVVDVTCVVRVVDHAIGDFSHLAGNMAEVWQKAVPLRWNAGKFLATVVLADPENEKGLPIRRSGRSDGR